MLFRSIMTVFEAFEVMGYASAITAFLFAYLDVRSSRPVRFGELGSGELESEAVGGLPGASTLRKRLRRLLLASTVLVCLNEFFGTGTFLSRPSLHAIKTSRSLFSGFKPISKFRLFFVY